MFRYNIRRYPRPSQCVGKSHLEEVKMTYFEHLKHAHTFSFIFFRSGVESFIHGIFPNCYTSCATDGIKKIKKSRV